MTLAAASAPIERTTCAHLSIAANGAVRSSRFDDFYFKPGCGAEESQYVFLQGNQLEQRWRDALDTVPAKAIPGSADLPGSTTHFSIAELGFGSGLNFLATLDLWCATHQSLPVASQPALYYYATEKYPLTRAALAKVLDHYNPYPEYASALLNQYPDAIGGDYVLRFNLHGCLVYLVLLFGDSVAALNRLEHYPVAAGRAPNPATLAIDAWYLDGFAPAKNPAMWRADLFTAIGRYSRHGSSAATFSAARAARDGLAAAGFRIAKRAGFQRKRDMLTANYAGASAATTAAAADRKYYSLAPCFARRFARRYAHSDVRRYAHAPNGNSYIDLPGESPAQNKARAEKQALVIGAGIAGCSTAALLAERGWQVTVVDQHASLAAGASGNRAAILYARTASQRAGLADFYEASFHYAVDFYRRLAASASQPDLASGLRGMLMLGQQLDARWQANNPETFSRKNVSAAEASALAGITLKKNGIYYPHSGFLQPLKICQALLDTPAITFVVAQDIAELQQRDENWTAIGAGGYRIEANVVVIACGTASHRFQQCQWLPLKALRGQTTDLPSHGALAALHIALCEKGYCTPALAADTQTGEPGRRIHSVGATYNPDFHGDALRALDHRDNIDKLAELLGFDPLDSRTLDSCALDQLGGRASARCVAPDYLPMVGSVVDRDAFLQRFASLRKNARRTPTASAPHTPGLYVNTAYGSHGFTMAPLASEILAAEIDGAPVPIADTLRQALSPSRFLVRQLIKASSATADSADSADIADSADVNRDAANSVVSAARAR